jgi:hypothetical protein
VITLASTLELEKKIPVTTLLTPEEMEQDWRKLPDPFTNKI